MFTTKANTTTNRDKIVDFNTTDDWFELDNAVFTKLANGVCPRRISAPAIRLSIATTTLSTTARPASCRTMRTVRVRALRFRSRFSKTRPNSRLAISGSSKSHRRKCLHPASFRCVQRSQDRPDKGDTSLTWCVTRDNSAEVRRRASAFLRSRDARPGRRARGKSGSLCIRAFGTACAGSCSTWRRR